MCLNGTACGAHQKQAQGGRLKVPCQGAMDNKYIADRFERGKVGGQFMKSERHTDVLPKPPVSPQKSLKRLKVFAGQFFVIALTKHSKSTV